MKESEVKEKYGISKKTGLGILVQIVLISMALALTLYGITTSVAFNRTIIYTGQALVCLVILFFGLIHFKERDMRFFKILINAYALFEALRVALITMDGVDYWIAVTAKFIMAIIVANCALLSERFFSERSAITSYILIILETVLYVLFLLGGASLVDDPADWFVPATGVLIAGSIALFLKAKKEQLAHPETDDGESALAHKMSNRIDEELKNAGAAFGDEDMNGIPDQFEKTEEDKKKYEEEHKASKN